MQYHLNVQEQQAALNGPDVVHCRLALQDEPGIELVPHSHKNWDTPEELNVRLAKNNKLPSDNLTTGKVIKLNAGDLLLFSANMIHRGLYGKNRLALDIIFCENAPQLTAFINAANTPSSAIANKTANPQVFFNPL